MTSSAKSTLSTITLAQHHQTLKIVYLFPKPKYFTGLQAFAGPYPRAHPDSINEDDKATLLDCVWAFYPKKKKYHVSDYHKVFNDTSYTKWWKEEFLPTLKALYHYHRQRQIPQSKIWMPKPNKMRKQECIHYLTSNEVEFENTESVKKLQALVYDCIDSKVKPEIVRSAEELGHTVIFLPA